MDIPEMAGAGLKIVREVVPSDPGSGRRPHTEAVLLVQILPCLFCSHGKCLGAEIMLLCGLSLVGPSMGLKQLCCQTLTKLVRDLLTGAVSCLQSSTLLLNMSSHGRVLDQRSLTIPRGQQGTRGAQRLLFTPFLCCAPVLQAFSSAVGFCSSPLKALPPGVSSLPPGAEEGRQAHT